MQKKVEELKKGDRIKLTDKIGIIEEIEFSDIGKQGKKKCRIVIKVGEERVAIIRPEGYPIDLV